MIVVQVRFRYAESQSGIPVVVLPLEEELVTQVSAWELVDSTTAQAVSVMEGKGSGHHGCQSMPSLDPREYVLATMDGKLVRNIEDMRTPLAATSEPMHTAFPYTHPLELLYIGPFGDFQRKQCLRLGGSRSLAVAVRAWERGRQTI